MIMFAVHFYQSMSISHSAARFHVDDRFPEHPLANRLKLAFNWIPEGTQRLLDAGCSSGYGTRFYATKAGETWGIDPDEVAVRVATQRYPSIHFQQGVLEHLPYNDAMFDTVVMADVFEHVENELATLNELFRVTKPGATLIISTPHRGLFGWLDPYNYGYYLWRYAPSLFTLLRGKPRYEIVPGEKHRHYSLHDFERLLQQSRFQNTYTITKVFRSGCFVFPLELNVGSILERIFGTRRAATLSAPLRWFAELDYWIPYGVLAFNIAIRVRRIDPGE